MGSFTKIFAISTITLIFSGCVAQPAGPKHNGADLNISKNAQFIEHENIKSATAILIKKSESYDRIGAEQKNLSSLISENTSLIKQLNTKNDDMSMKLLFLTDEINLLKNELAALKMKQKDSTLPAISTPAASTPPTTQLPIDSIAAPSVKIESVPNTKVSNVPVKTSQKKRPTAQKATQKCQSAPSKKKVINADPIIETFSDSEGKIIVNKKGVFVRSAPVAEKKYVSANVGEGDVFTYIAQSPNWYKLKSGSYISKKVVVDLSAAKKVK